MIRPFIRSYWPFWDVPDKYPYIMIGNIFQKPRALGISHRLGNKFGIEVMKMVISSWFLHSVRVICLMSTRGRVCGRVSRWLSWHFSICSRWLTYKHRVVFCSEINLCTIDVANSFRTFFDQQNNDRSHRNRTISRSDILFQHLEQVFNYIVCCDLWIHVFCNRLFRNVAVLNNNVTVKYWCFFFHFHFKILK